MKKVMIYAYTYFNLGDDLFIKVLCERYPHVKFYIFAPKPYKDTFKDLPNLTIYPSNSFVIRGIDVLWRWFKTYHFSRRTVAKTCDASVHIGGSLFIQSDSWKNELNYTKALYIKNQPFFLLGANFGPFSHWEFYMEHKKIFKQYSDICFREHYSYDLFSDLQHVRQADDIIFQLQPPQTEQNSNKVIISVIKPSIRKHLKGYNDRYYETIKEIALYLIDQGYHVTLMAFCQYEQDDQAINHILQLVPDHYLKHMSTYTYTSHLEEALLTLSQACFIIATRLHAMILGWIFKKPVYPIVYSDKMTHIMQDIGFMGPYTTFKQLENLSPQDVYNSIHTNPVDIREQLKHSEKQFEKLDQFLLP